MSVIAYGLGVGDVVGGASAYGFGIHELLELQIIVTLGIIVYQELRRCIIDLEI